MLRDAYTFIVPLCLLGAISFLIGWWAVPGFYIGAGVFFAFALFVAFFFRDPERQLPSDERLVVSPADGRVVVVKPFTNEQGEAATLVSIFLSVFDVHVNRAPIAGKILSADYHPGKFLIATLEKASVENEQTVITLENEHMRVTFKQIAGLIARRIVLWKKTGDLLKLGERVGLIKFGSRVDIILPRQIRVLVKKGDHVKGGISIIGKVGNER